MCLSYLVLPDSAAIYVGVGVQTKCANSYQTVKCWWYRFLNSLRTLLNVFQWAKGAGLFVRGSTVESLVSSVFCSSGLCTVLTVLLLRFMSL